MRYCPRRLMASEFCRYERVSSFANPEHPQRDSNPCRRLERGACRPSLSCSFVSAPLMSRTNRARSCQPDTLRASSFWHGSGTETVPLRCFSRQAESVPPITAAFHSEAITRGAKPSPRALLSYQLCYHCVMATRDKRSVSLPPDLAKAIDAAAAASGTSFSAWVADTASHRLRLEAGRRGVAEWEAEHGPLSERELAEGLARARELLGRTASKRSA
jgi:hypothetical protein